MNLNPYLNFQGNAREAMEFYQSVLGGELALDEFSSYPDMGIPEAELSLLMHAQLTTDDGLVLMGSDVPSTMPFEAPAGFSVSISGEDAERLQAIWDAFAAEGEIGLPYETPPWGGKFGMVTDKFGIDWMVALNDAN